MEKYVLFGVFVSLIIGSIISLFASTEPDGLEKVAEEHGFIEKEEKVFESPMPDYTIPQIENEVLSASLSGFIGTLCMFTLGILLGKALKK